MLYAIEAVLDIGYHAADQLVQSHDISRRQGIPRRYLEQVLQTLVREDILIGVRGPRGGYRLARDRDAIAIGEIVHIVRALESKGDPVATVNGSPLGEQVLKPLWRDMQDTLMGQLNTVSVDDLCQQATSLGLKSDC